MSHSSLVSRAMALVLFGLIAFGLPPQLHAYTQATFQTAADGTVETIPLDATVQVSPPKITIQTYVPGTFSIYKKDPAVNTWTSAATGIVLAANGTWTDNNVSVGTAYEYKFVNTSGTAYSSIYPTGYIICGIQYDQTQPKGITALVVASDLPVNLPAEYAQYKADLVADGWNVREIQVPRAPNYNGIGNGALASVNIVVGGTGYSSGTVGLTNSSGKYALGILTVNGSTGAITGVNMGLSSSGVAQPGSAGAGFAVGDALTIMGGGGIGSGAILAAHIDETQAMLDSYVFPVSGGSGYTNGDSVTLTGQTSNAAAQCQLNVDTGGAISYFTISSPGTGFVAGETLGMTGNTTGSGVGPLTAYTGTNGKLTSVSMHPPGPGYVNGETITLTGSQSGKTAQVTVNLDSSGYISYGSVVSSQAGFIGSEALIPSGGSGTGAPPFTGSVVGPLQSVSVVAGGSNYVNGNVVTINYGSTPAKGVLSVTSGSITGITITSGGQGFTYGDYVYLSGLQSNNTSYNLTVKTIDNSDAGRAANVTVGGSGYTDNDTVAIKGATSGATAVGSIIAPAGAMTGVSVVLPNTFASGEPLTLTPASGGSGATAVTGTSLVENHLLIRSAVQAIYNAFPGQLKNVVLVGKVPVCRSGLNDGAGSDGHGNEAPYGADAFYADMDGVVGIDWTDTGDNTGSVYTDYNIPGDKQFDQQSILDVGNGMVELGFGRMDLSSGIYSEIEAHRNYFGKLHRYKTADPSFLPGRMVCDRLMYPNEREADLQSMPGVVGMNNIQFITTGLPTVPNNWDSDQVYTTQNGPFLFYFKGSGGPGIGINGKAVFWTGMQSHWGYWYQGFNSMQQRLAENSFTLDFTWNIWGMRYLYHRMGMGFDAGDMMKQSINNDGWGKGPYTYKFNNTSNGDYHGALYMNQMGDPALRLFMFAPPSALSVVKTGGNPVLSWTASTDSSVVGYHVYRAANANGFFTRLTSTLVTGSNTYTDSTVTAGKYVYMVRAIHLENTGGGTFYNPSLGITQSVNLDATPSLVSNVTSSLPIFYWNTSGSATLSAQGGVPQYSWSIISGTLPAGLNLSPTGVISGTATAIGNFPITVQATDQIGQTKPQALTLTVNSSNQTVIQPTDTTYTATNLPTYNYGISETDVISGSATYTVGCETFHRYDLSGLNANNGVTQATLYLYVTANTGTTTISAVQANLLADAADGWIANGGLLIPFSSAAASPVSGYTRINCPNHGFVIGTNGAQVTLAGLTGFPTTAYAITVIDANNFDIPITYGNWAYTSATAKVTSVGMTYNTRPTTYDTNVPTLIAAGTDTPGTLLQFDVTSYVREALANFPSKQMGIRFFTPTPQIVYVGSLNAYGGAIPYLVVQTSNAPKIVINSPATNPAFIYPGQGVLLNAIVTPLPSRAGSLALQWSKVSGPGSVTFTDPTSAATGATFSTLGDYVLQLTANDGVAQSSQTVTVRVVAIPVTGPATGMVLRMPLDETSGTIVHDLSGVSPANAGTLAHVSGSANPVWSSTGGVIGGALSLSGSGQEIVVPDSATNLLDGMSQMSISLWFYAYSFPTSGSIYTGLVSKRLGSYNHESYSINVRGGTAPLKLNYDVNNKGSSSFTACATNKWYHVVMVFDGTLSTNNLKLYLNGLPDSFCTAASQPTVPRNPTAPLYIGAADNADTSGWNALVDEVRIYNKALTFAEVQDLYAAAPSDVGPKITTASSVSGSAGVPFPLAASVTDDGLGGPLTLGWSTIVGPGSATFDNPAAATTNATCPLGGTFTLRLIASDGTIATFADVAANITGQAFASWASTKGLTGPNATSTACPAGDGVSNLMKYALGLDPNRVCTALTDGTNAGLPLVASDASSLSLTYQRDTAKTDITYVVEAGTDLAAWSNNGVTEQILSTNGTVQTVKASVPKGSNSKEFIRLRVVK